MSSPFSNLLDTDEATQIIKGYLKLGKPLPSSLPDNDTLVDTKVSDEEDNMGEDMMDYQEIVFTENEDDFAHRVHGHEVKIVCSSMDHNSGSSKVKIQNIVDFSWKQKYYLGRLVTVHVSGNFLAYSLTVQNIDKVRVINPKTDRRALIKGFTGQVKDLSFSHSVDQVLLACVDECGSFVVHKIVDDGTELTSHCILCFKNNRETLPSDYHMVFWCAYIPEEPGDMMDPTASVVSKLLVVTNNREAEVWNVSLAAKKYSGKQLSDESSVRRIVEHSQPITCAAFSPDGSALATASLDGEVKFFEVDVQDKDKDANPSCLHQWKPHNGKPVSCLFFLDNLKSPQPDVQLWKCALTGADNNQELKLWSCESWNCLQTIRFVAKAGETLQPCLKAELDFSAGYLLLSDINYKVVYVLQLFQNNFGSNVQVCSIAKFPVILPVLSMAVVDATLCKFKLLGDPDHYQKHDVGEQNGDDEQHDGEIVVKGAALKLFWINTKSVQESRITYQPSVLLTSNPEESLHMLSQDSIVYKDRLSDLSTDIQDLLSDGEMRKSTSSFQSPNAAQFSQNLMDNNVILLTPDDFTSPTHGSTLTPSSVTPVVPPEMVVTHRVLNLNLNETEEPPLATSEEITLVRRKSSQRSSLSSPSQEVEDILAPVTIKCESERNGDFVDNDTSQLEPEVEKDIKPILVNSHFQQDVAPPSIPTRNDLGGTPPTRKSGEFGSWPQAPDLSKQYKMVSQKIETNHVARKEVAPSFWEETVALGVGDVANIDNNCNNNLLCKINESIESLNRSINDLTGIARQQGTQIVAIQDELRKQHDQEKTIQHLLHRMEVMEKKVCNKVESVSADHSRSELTKLKALFAEREESDRKWLEKHAATVSQNVSMTAKNKLENTVKTEFKTSVLPQMTRSLDTWKDSMHQDILNKMVSTEVNLRENFSKMVKSKVFIDSIAQSVGSCIQPHLHAMCQEVFVNKFVPTIERVCQNLFVQMSETFKQGINEYLQQTKCLMEQSNKQCQKNLVSAVNSQIEEQSKSATVLQEKLLSSIVPAVNEQIQNLLQDSFSKQNEQIAVNIRKVVAEEIKLFVRQQPAFVDGAISAISSRTVTPVPHAVDPQMMQQQILQCLRQGQYNMAFQQALSAADLSLVVLVCQNVKPSDVFGHSGHPLKPAILLSLIHQLGTDLNSHTDLKLRYLQEALMTLDTASPLAKDHLPNVLNPLRQKLSSYLQHNPGTPNSSIVKMILLATQTLLNTLS